MGLIDGSLLAESYWNFLPLIIDKWNEMEQTQKPITPGKCGPESMFNTTSGGDQQRQGWMPTNQSETQAVRAQMWGRRTSISILVSRGEQHTWTIIVGSENSDADSHQALWHSMEGRDCIVSHSSWTNIPESCILCFCTEKNQPMDQHNPFWECSLRYVRWQTRISLWEIHGN